MSTAPQGFQTPKSNWTPSDPVGTEDLNRIEANINAIEQGSRTLDPAQAPSGSVGTLRQLLDWFANRLKAILGTTNWYDIPPTTLQAAKAHIDASAPHSGHALSEHTHSGDDITSPVASANYATAAGSASSADDADAVRSSTVHNLSFAVLLQALTERSASSTSLLKRFRLNCFGRLRIQFQVKVSVGATAVVKLVSIPSYLDNYEQTPTLLALGQTDTINANVYVTREFELYGVVPGMEIGLQVVPTSGTAYICNVKVMGSPSAISPAVVLD